MGFSAHALSNLKYLQRGRVRSQAAGFAGRVYLIIRFIRVMDVARELLNNLMGRDRNKPKGDTSGRDHYSNRDVCKPYLICFCFNTLFPNTVYDEGPCHRRHDTYLKTMFDNDLTRAEHEKEYIKECINWIEKRLVDVEQKIKKNQSVIDTKSTFTGDRPKNVLDRIVAIEEDIENMMKQAEIFGENGQIDESARCLEEVERLRERRREVESMNDTTNSVQKQQKICEICGAIQTINDTQKRIQTHLEGKIHQGFLKLRHEVETLRVRLEMLTQLDPQPKKEESHHHHHHNHNHNHTEERAAEKQEKKKDHSRSQSKKKKKEKDRERSREKKQKKEGKEERHKEERRRDSREDRHKEDKHKEDKKKKHKKERSRSKDRRSRSKDRRSRSKDKQRERERE